MEPMPVEINCVGMELCPLVEPNATEPELVALIAP